jgi:hypothetical protein
VYYVGMASYAQILKNETQGRRQLWFIAGPEKALVQDALELAKSHATSGAESVYQTVFIAGEDTAETVARRLLERGHERSVVILLDADKFAEWSVLEPILRKLPKSDFFIAVSNEDKPDETRQHIAVFKTPPKGRYVLCKPFDVATAVEWVGTRLNIQKSAATYLIERSKGDTEWLLSTIRKLETLGGFVSLDFVEKTVVGSGCPDFRDSLLHYRKRDAVLSLWAQTPNPSTIGNVVEDVRKASIIKEATRAIGFFSINRIRERTRMQNKTIVKYRDVSLLYDRQNTLKSLRAVSHLHEGLVRGNKSSWLSLVSRW